jgi:hypothetical protein
MNSKITVLKREVKKLPGLFSYESENEGWKGKKYYRFRYDEKVFVVHEDDDFIKDWDANKVQEVKIMITPEGANFLNHANREDLIEEAKFEAMLADIKIGSAKAKPVENEAQLNALG